MTPKKKTSPKEQDKMERDKKLLMGAGIVFFMSLIVILWVFNIQRTFQNTGLTNSRNQEGISEFTQDFSSTMDDIKKEVKSFKTVATDSGSDSGQGNSGSDQSEREQDISSSTIRALKKNLEKKFE